MKRNDTVSILVYVAMLAIAVIVGMTLIRPVAIEPGIAETMGGLSPIVVIILAVIVGIVLNALLIEVGHLVGAKIGKYEIRSLIILGIGARKNKDGKWQFKAGGFDGLTGETRVIAKDREKSSLRAYVYFPLLLILLEIIVFSVLMAVSGGESLSSMAWLYISSLTILTISGMILLYDIFPMPLDSSNDGFRLVLISNPKNKAAYNDYLLTEECRRLEQPLPEIKPYTDLTDFTATINNAILYDHLEKGEYDKAIEIAKLAINGKDSVSKEIYGDAVCMRLSLELLADDISEVKQRFIDMRTEDKKYIAMMPSLPSVRAYLLISGLIEESESETEVAMAREITLIKKADDKTKAIEKKLYKEALALVRSKHPDWESIMPRKSAEEAPKAEAAPKEEHKDE